MPLTKEHTNTHCPPWLLKPQDYEHVVAFAYGVKGRFKHLLESSAFEANQPPKRSRPAKYMLAPLPGEARETFSLALLNRLVLEQQGGQTEDRKVGGGRDQGSRNEGREEGSSSGGGGGGDGGGGKAGKRKTKSEKGDKKTASGAAAVPAAAPSSPTPADASVRLQLAVLRHLVPPLWTRKVKHQPAGGNLGGLITGWTRAETEAETHSTEGAAAAAAAAATAPAAAEEEEEEEEEGEEEEEEEEGGEGESEVGGRKRFRQNWMPKPWDVDRSPLPLHPAVSGAGVGAPGVSSSPDTGRRPTQCWPGGESKDWEVHHLALLTTTFKPDITRRLWLDGSSDGLGRVWRRSYKRVLTKNEAATAGELKISGVPASWRGEEEEKEEEEGGAVATTDGEKKEDGQIVLRYRDKVVDTFTWKEPC